MFMRSVTVFNVVFYQITRVLCYGFSSFVFTHGLPTHVPMPVCIYIYLP